jgi:2,3-bisphosphoglycerate-dependent phosphoglycerate mutase
VSAADPADSGPSVPAQPIGAARLPSGVEPDAAPIPSRGRPHRGSPDEPSLCAELIVVRHGQSTSNAAFAAGATSVSGRDADIDLTPLGAEQSVALGEAIAGWPPDRRPEVALCSPFLRARRTYEIAAAAAEAHGVTLPVARIDNRLPDRDMGDLELRPWPVIAASYPSEVDRANTEGVYHYRPPGGESLADVADRLLSLLGDINHEYAGRRVIVIAHDAIVAILHYLIDRPSLEDFTRHLGENPASNASVTRFIDRNGRLRMVDYNNVDHLGPTDRSA